MIPLCFLIERERQTKSNILPLEARRDERLRLSANFWCIDSEPHTLVVVSERPDGARCALATITQACHRTPGVLVMRSTLIPLEVGGWHRIHMEMDGAALGAAKSIFVLGPQPPRVRYKGRGAMRAEPQQDAETHDDPLAKVAGKGRRG